MLNNFTEIFTESFQVLKKSINPVLKVLGICAGGVAIGTMAILVSMGPQVFSAMGDSAQFQSYMEATSWVNGLLALVFFLATSLFCYVCYCWGILIIRNKTLGIEMPLKEVFSEAFRKFWKVLIACCLLGFIIFIVMAAEVTLPFLLLSKDYAVFAVFLIIPLIMITMLLITPPCFAVFYGLLCREGNFFTILGESLRLGFKKWVIIVIFFVLITGICSIPVGMCMGTLMVLLAMANLAIVANVLYMIVNVAVGFLSACFFTVLYVNISGMKEQFSVQQMPAEQIPAEQMPQ